MTHGSSQALPMLPISSKKDYFNGCWTGPDTVMNTQSSATPIVLHNKVMEKSPIYESFTSILLESQMIRSPPAAPRDGNLHHLLSFLPHKKVTNFSDILTCFISYNTIKNGLHFLIVCLRALAFVPIEPPLCSKLLYSNSSSRDEFPSKCWACLPFLFLTLLLTSVVAALFISINILDIDSSFPFV